VIRRTLALLLTGLTALVSLGAPIPSANASLDYSGFYSQQHLTEAGWSACVPVTWSVDVTGMTPREARSEIRRLSQAWDAWSSVSGIQTEFVGRERLVFDPDSMGLRPMTGAARSDHHVYVAFKSGRQVPIMASNAVGLAMPTAVVLTTQEITAGMAIFRRDYVLEQRRAAPDRVRHLYIHELGHILGLGHARSQGNVMYPTLTESTRLGDGDRAGVKAMTHPCPSG
jgi:hypothetical protein